MPDPIFDGVFDEMFAPGAHIGLHAGDYTLTASEYKDGIAFTVLGGDRSGAGVVIPSGIAKASIWRADPANTYPVFVRCAGTVELAPGDRLTIITDKNGRITGAELGQAVGSSAWQEIDEAHTALAGEHLDIDTTSAAITVTLPADPAKFDEVFFRNSAQSFATHALTIGRNGETIMGLAQDMTCNTDGDDFSLWFNGETWQFPGAQL